MPKIEQYDWSKLQPPQKNVGSSRGTKDYATYEFIEPHKKSKNSATTVIKPPINKRRKVVKTTSKKKRPKVIDKTIYQYNDKAILSKLRNIT